MKRRTFLTASSTVGIVGAVSGASLVSSAYTSISASVLLEEFTPATKSTLDKFMTDVALNTQALGLDEKFVKMVAMPVQIISNKSKGDHHKITYKNKSGEYISLSVIKGVERIEVSKTLR